MRGRLRAFGPGTAVRVFTLASTLVVVLFTARPGAAQDIEVAAQHFGRELPEAYYQRIREQPDIFEVQRGWIARNEAVAAANQEVRGTLPLVVIQALFADSPEPHISTQQIQQVLFDGPAPYGTLTEFYREISGSRLHVQGRVLPWVRTQTAVAAAVGSNYGLGSDARTGDYLLQALVAADSLVDFGQFDNDGPDGRPNSGDDDGYVDAVVFQFLERGASCGGPAIWPHRSRMSGWTGTAFRTNDLRPNGQPILANDYIIQSTVNCATGELQTASIISHELAHVLGLPDLYDASQGIEPDKRRWVVGCWSLMAAGAWGCGGMNQPLEANRPPHMGAWEKEQLGWARVSAVPAAAGEVTLSPVRASEQVLRIDLSDKEYLLVEYRDRQGFDVDLPAAGVLVYRVDLTKPFRPCATCAPEYRVSLVEADGNRSLVRTMAEGGSRGEPGDAFGVLGPGRLARLTLPSASQNSGTLGSVTLANIRVEGGVARFNLAAAPLPAERLLQPLLRNGAAPLTADEQALLDAFGNANGSYDVGDFRALLRAFPSLGSGAR